jgi:hypothetical protein
MAIGNPASKADVNATITAVARQLHGAFALVDQFKIWLDATIDADLTTMGFAAGDISQLRSAMTDAAALATVFRGTGTRTPAYDHRTFLKLALPSGTF